MGIMLSAAAAAGLISPAYAQGPAATQAISPVDDCDTKRDGPNAITVCGKRDRNARYRIPEELREDPAKGETSWSARVTEMNEASRNADPAVGPDGYIRHHREWVREAKLEREQKAPVRRKEARGIERHGR